MNKVKCCLGLIMIITLAGCTSTGVRYEEGEWIYGIPTKSYYNKVYQRDQALQEHQSRSEYHKWVLQFFEGKALVPGWLDTEKRVLEEVGKRNSIPVLSAKLSYLGQLISGEWAKAEEVREIDTRMLRIWTWVLRKASNDQRTTEAIDRVTEDVLKLLSQELEPDQIKKERYSELI